MIVKAKFGRKIESSLSMRFFGEEVKVYLSLKKLSFSFIILPAKKNKMFSRNIRLSRVDGFDLFIRSRYKIKRRRLNDFLSVPFAAPYLIIDYEKLNICPE